MNEKAAIFKPDAIKIQFGDETFNLVFDLNAFCELEKIYDSVDAVIQMVLGTQESVDPKALLTQVKFGDAFIDGEMVTIAGTPLLDYLTKVHVKQAKHADTLNLLWVACMHDNAVYNEHDEIVGYNVSKRQLGSYVTFKNLREVNAKLVSALLRDLIPSKNSEEPTQEAATEEAAQIIQLHNEEPSDN